MDSWMVRLFPYLSFLVKVGVQYHVEVVVLFLLADGFVVRYLCLCGVVEHLFVLSPWD